MKDRDPAISAPTLEKMAYDDDVRRLKEEIADFRADVALERAYDRQRITRLETINQATKRAKIANGEVLKAILAANGGAMAQKDARKLLGMDESNFSKLVKSMSDVIEVRRSTLDKRRNILRLK